MVRDRNPTLFNPPFLAMQKAHLAHFFCIVPPLDSKMGVILLSTVLVQQGRECREEVGEGRSGGGLTLLSSKALERI